MTDLDDFFAKKDKKKSKTKKFSTSEELAKKLEDTSKKTESKPRKEIAPNATTGDAEEGKNGEPVSCINC